MSQDWNLETVADSKPETPPPKTSELQAAPVSPIPSVLSNDHTLGKIMAMAREARGLSREQAASTSHIPAYYLTMIESDDYSSIADQLYLLPFLRRYASFIGLEPEEVASRFIRDVQRADMSPGRPSEPITMFTERKPLPWNTILMAGAAVVVIAIGWIGYRHFSAPKAAPAKPAEAPIAAQPSASKPQEAAPVQETAPAEDTAPADDESAAPGEIPPPPPAAPAPSAPKHAAAPASSTAHGHPPAKPHVPSDQ